MFQKIVTVLTVMGLVLTPVLADAKKKKKKVQEPTVNCPEPGTSVPFAKVMNAAFAKDYKGCQITSEGEFYATGPGMMVLPFDTGDDVVFRAVPPGVEPSGNALSGEGQAFYASVPKDASDLLFEVTKGTPILLTGGTEVFVQTAGDVHVMTWVLFKAAKLELTRAE